MGLLQVYSGLGDKTFAWWGLPETWQDRLDRKMIFLAQGTADGTAKTWRDRQTFFKQNTDDTVTQRRRCAPLGVFYGPVILGSTLVGLQWSDTYDRVAMVLQRRTHRIALSLLSWIRDSEQRHTVRYVFCVSYVDKSHWAMSIVINIDLCDADWY